MSVADPSVKERAPLGNQAQTFGVVDDAKLGIGELGDRVEIPRPGRFQDIGDLPRVFRPSEGPSI